MENAGSVVVVTPPAPEVPADPIPAEVTIEAPAPAPDPDPEQIREAAAEAIENQRQELREELLSAEALNRLRGDTQSIRDQTANLREQVSALTGELSSLKSNLAAVLEALTTPTEEGEASPTPASPAPAVELAPKPRSIWEALQ